MLLKARLVFSQLFIWAGGGAVNAVIGSTLGLWLAVFAVAIVGFIVVTMWDRIMPWWLRGGTAGNQHEPYQIDVRETSEVSFRPFLHVAVHLGIANRSDTSMHIQSVELDARLARGWRGRFVAIPLESVQVGGDLIRPSESRTSLIIIEPRERFLGDVHFYQPDEIEIDALRSFRLTVDVEGQKCQRFRFFVKEKQAAYLSQSTIRIP